MTRADIIKWMHDGARVDCMTLEQRRDVLRALRDAGVRLTSPAEIHLSEQDSDFNYPAVGLFPSLFPSSPETADCWLDAGKAPISYDDFMMAFSCRDTEFTPADPADFDLLFGGAQ
jgi:hypothetical protein